MKHFTALASTLSGHPTLNRKKAEGLWDSIRAVLEEGIRRNGASIDWVYRGGDFQNYFRVYDRAGQPCRFSLFIFW